MKTLFSAGGEGAHFRCVRALIKDKGVADFTATPLDFL
jgi:hypothetical protein